MERPQRPFGFRRSTIAGKSQAARKARFAFEFPRLMQEFRAWERSPERKKINRKKIAGNVAAFGGNFIREFEARAGRLREIGIMRLDRTYETPYGIEDRRLGVKAHLSFFEVKSRKAIIVDGIQGQNPEEKQPKAANEMMKLIIGIAKNAGCNTVFLRKPETHPYYEHDATELTSMWRRRMGAEVGVNEVERIMTQERRPTSFELREIELANQESMRKLYYGIATAFKFKKPKKGKYMQLSI